MLSGIMEKQEFAFQLRDPETGKTVNGKVVAENYGLEIFIEGYGNYSCESGQGSPLFLEIWDGELRAVLWSNINEEDPTHVVSLEKAREDSRDEALDDD